MNISIDDKYCRELGLSTLEVLILYTIQNPAYLQTMTSLRSRGMITNIDGKWTVPQETKSMIAKVIKSQEDEEDRLRNLATRMIQCYPPGKMPGTPFYYRCNVTEISNKMRKFLIKYNKGDRFSDDDIVKATEQYVASFHGDFRYLPLIKYFISKLKTVEDEDGNNRKVEHSPLADYLENSTLEDIAIPEDDWVMNIKN